MRLYEPGMLRKAEKRILVKKNIRRKSMEDKLLYIKKSLYFLQIVNQNSNHFQ